MVISFLISFNKAIPTFAAVTPSLGDASTFAVLASTYTNTLAGTTITGDVGYTTGPAMVPAIIGTTHVADATYGLAGSSQNSALVSLASHTCTFIFGGGEINLSTDTTHGSIGVYTPGVYCSSGAMKVGGPLTLSGSGTYIFRSDGALTSTDGSIVTLSGASACDVFWTPTQATTLSANTTFRGTVISNAGITIGANTSWIGRALAYGGTILTDTDSISVPSCSVPLPATLHIIKTVINNNGGIATTSSFSLHVKLVGIDVSGSPSNGTVSPGTSYSLNPGTYVVSEGSNSLYTKTFSGSCDASGNITLAPGDNKTCTITNDDIAPVPATLHIIKQVTNNDGGVATSSSFSLHVKLAGVDVSGSPVNGTTTPGTSYSLAAGTYVVSENNNSDYTKAFSGDCDASGNITLAAGENKTCTITNDDIAPPPFPATFHVIKTVINNDGGTATSSSFVLHVKLARTDVSGSPANGTTTPGTSYSLAAGTYAVSEDTNSLYTKTFSGDCDVSGNITLAAGENKTCTITNDDIVPVVYTGNINVVKIVINDNGGSKAIPDFPLFVNGTLVISGITNSFLASTSAYRVSEISNSKYTKTFSGDCDVNGDINLNSGDNKFCIITNNDIAPVASPVSYDGGGTLYIAPVPPLIDLVKVPSPLALPNGPGVVTYSYILKNIGTVPVTDITMVGDTCRPINLSSGDLNNNRILDLKETWIYQCSVLLRETHTNNIVATGRANGLIATDIANATVIVGLPVVPPLIHVTKSPSHLILPAGGGMVTHTETITNPGTVALSNVTLIDDQCSPMKYISGDLNNDSKLDTSESWIYTCKSNLSMTTTNTAIASGEAYGLLARDLAIATVVVANIAPKFPNVGLAPEEGITMKELLIFISVIFLGLASLILLKRKGTN